MKIAPLSQKHQDALVWPIIILTAPVWAPLLGIIITVAWLESKLDPPGWRRVFAWWPVECDPWPDAGYSGWVWLEMVWRNPNSQGWSFYRREAPVSQPSPQSGSPAGFGVSQEANNET